ncbi:hypothetical protein [Rubripirellula tenax]|nr:hypothetical protein [Rubripirellula tenax]
MFFSNPADAMGVPQSQPNSIGHPQIVRAKGLTLNRGLCGPDSVTPKAL